MTEHQVTNNHEILDGKLADRASASNNAIAKKCLHSHRQESHQNKKCKKNRKKYQSTHRPNEYGKFLFQTG